MTKTIQGNNTYWTWRFLKYGELKQYKYVISILGFRFAFVSSSDFEGRLHVDVW